MNLHEIKTQPDLIHLLQTYWTRTYPTHEYVVLSITINPPTIHYLRDGTPRDLDGYNARQHINIARQLLTS